MKFRHGIKILLLSLLPVQLFAADSYYCPQNMGYINPGMSQAKVVEACGQPVRKQKTDEPVTKKIPVTQLIYNNKGTDTAFYGTHNIPVGSGGANLEVDVAYNKVVAIRINGSSSNSFSICDGSSVQRGDQISHVYNACGNPSVINNTFVHQNVPGEQKKEIWVYQPDPYQAPVNLTFINGKLQSIDK